jgi:hypothetical protein
MNWILFYYNSLPDMPAGCKLFSEDVMHRDFFMCNPSNTGHYRYPKFETLSYDEGCHSREVKKMLRQIGNYCRKDHYVVFYTRHTNLQGQKKNRIVGYFKVGKTNKFKDRITGESLEGFCSSEHLLLPKKECIETTYMSRGVPVSWGTSAIAKRDVNKLLNSRKDLQGHDITNKYKKETASIMAQLLSFSGRKKIISICENCKVRSQCCWGRKSYRKKESKLTELYGGFRVC